MLTEEPPNANPELEELEYTECATDSPCSRFAGDRHFAGPPGQSSRSSSIFAPVSTPADSIFELSLFVLAVTGGIFVVVFGLLVYVVVQFRREKNDDGSEPPQVYGSNQMELAWTIIPVLIVVALFLATARVIARVQDAPATTRRVDVDVIGHQFWWEYRYPQYGS